MTHSVLSRVAKKHGSAYLHSALVRRGTTLYRTRGKDNTKSLNMRYIEYERKKERKKERKRERERERERERGGGKGELYTF